MTETCGYRVSSGLNNIEKDILLSVVMVLYKTAVKKTSEVIKHNDLAFHKDLVLNCVRCTIMFDENVKYFKDYWDVVVTGNPLPQETPIDGLVEDTLRLIRHIRSESLRRTLTVSDDEIYEILIFMTILTGTHPELDPYEEITNFLDEAGEDSDIDVEDSEDSETETDDTDDEESEVNVSDIVCTCATCFRCRHAVEFWREFCPEDDVTRRICELLG